MIAINTPTGGDKELKSREKSLINGKTNEISKLLGNSKITGNPELVQNLKDYRESWKNFTHIFDKNGMENVVKIADKIHINIDKDEDGGRLIEFKLGDKTYKILNPNLKNHSNNEYVKDIKHRAGIENR